MENTQHKILGMSYAEGDEEGNPVFEYVISDYEYLVWEYELKLV